MSSIIGLSFFPPFYVKEFYGMLIWNTATENDMPDITSPGDKGVHSITLTPCGAPTVTLIMQQALLAHLYFFRMWSSGTITHLSQWIQWKCCLGVQAAINH